MKTPGTNRERTDRSGVPLVLQLVCVVIIVAIVTDSMYGPSAGGGAFHPEPGDLLFQDLDAGPLCDAIELVTFGVRGASISHVGIVCGPNGEVLEAVSQGVRITPLPNFLERSRDSGGRPKVVVGRLKDDRLALIPAALEYGSALVGRPYDKAFEIDNAAYYCSELIYEIFARANGGEPVFELGPMTFRHPDTNQTLPAWTHYFADLGIPVPEGRSGINPGGISRSAEIEIVHAYGTPAGWTE